jgi:predicted TIM-barrel enzyme
MCLLPIHDANGRLLEALDRRPAALPYSYAGIFAVDPFRRHADILAALKLAQFPRVANFPSLCLIDGEVRNDLEELGFGFSREVEFIRAAVGQGFSAAAVVDTAEAGAQMIVSGVSLLIAANASVETLSRLAGLAAGASVRLALLASDE